uniref:Threonylcarbamoyl-AMP synthase n=1 Tax=Panagrolaimus sp. JU765 TaxID=591449 RepID=A0AC34R945_9BILA
MAQIVKLSTDNEFLEAAQKAKNVLGNGGIVALPTDTIYGISTTLDFVDKIYKLKRRPFEKPLGLFVGKIDQIYQFANVEVSRNLLEALLPGPVTLIFNRKPTLPASFNPGVRKVGFRIPDSKFVQLLANIIEEPIAQTSANVSGSPMSPICIKILANLIEEPIAQTSANVSGSPMSPICIKDFEDLWPCIDLIIDSGPIIQHDFNRAGSTIIDLTDPGKFTFVRLGCAAPESAKILESFGLENSENEVEYALK